MLATLHYIVRADPRMSKRNVRKHGPGDIATLAASITALGALQPRLFRPNGDGSGKVDGWLPRQLAVPQAAYAGAPAHSAPARPAA